MRLPYDYNMPDYEYFFRDYEDEYPCPECGEGIMRIVDCEFYGADRDGNRGIKIYIYGCDRCGYEEG